MHGENNQLFPSLSHLKLSERSKDNLYLGDIYNYKLNASLAVLSACNTGRGKYLKGEGAQNISRAFQFAGVKSTLMSLWSIPDIQTAQLNKGFFQNLNDGQRKDESLRFAKLEFLDQAPKVFQHPFYWAGQVVVGQMEALDPNNGQKTHFLWGLLGMLFMLALIFYKKRLT